MKSALLSILLTLTIGCHAGRIGSLSQSVQDAQQEVGDVWAILVAGSNGYYNYRHQADVCHAYQVLRSHGVPDERIIVLMYDDIANSEDNPTPGIIINQPNGSNVYTGVPKDFTGDDVTSENFLKVLAGDSDLRRNGRKVLQSGPKDNVFIYFSDHGAEGLIAFPNDVLLAKQLNKGLRDLHDANGFKQLVIYIEACEAGSMFKNLLPDNISVYAVTASDESESSYAIYFDKEREAYLGDEFSVNWMEDSDAHPDLSRETLKQQYQAVKRKTKQSHVSLYGDKSIGDQAVSDFQGSKVPQRLENRFQRRDDGDTVRSPDVPLVVARMRAESSPQDERLQTEFKTMLHGRSFVDKSRELIGERLIEAFGFSEEILSRKLPLTQHDCYETLFRTFDETCFRVSTHPYALRSLYFLVNVCETLEQTSQEVFGVESVATVLSEECRQQVREHPFTSIQ